MTVSDIGTRIDRKNLRHPDAAGARQIHRPCLLLKGALPVTTDPHVDDQLARERHAVHLVVVTPDEPFDLLNIPARCPLSKSNDMRTL